MGGAKCSYRNCTVKSDGVTHMFHYPVFDKLRCHHWLKNSHRLEFLNLKVSQLKNRVVCQNHFKPDCFMNYKMDKLKHDAIPTENGPFCDAEDWIENDVQVLQALNLDPDEIENEPLSLREKQANLKVKFADFLVNGEMDTTATLKIQDVSANYGTNLETTYSVANKKQPVQKVQQLTDSKTLKAKTVSAKTESKPAATNRSVEIEVPPRNNSRVRIISEKKITTPVTVPGRLEPISPSIPIRPRDKNHDSSNNVLGEIVLKNEALDRTSTAEVFLRNPQTVAQNEINESFQPFETSNSNIHVDIKIKPQNNSCQIVVNPTDRIFDVNMAHPVNLQTNIENVPHSVQLLDLSQSLPVSHGQQTQQTNLQIQQTNLQELQEILQNKRFQSQNAEPQSISAPVSKTKIPPERIAAIEEKRKFNKKLRDMIEFCLDGIDTPEKHKDGKPVNETDGKQRNVTPFKRRIMRAKSVAGNIDQYLSFATKEPMQNKKLNQQRESLLKNKEKSDESIEVYSHLSKEPTLPSKDNYAMAAIEARLIKMEETLLRKIEQNSQRIVDLKDVVEASKIPTPKTRSVSNQTSETQEVCKKRLYEEISHFLSPDTRSIVFEEMFLKQHSRNYQKEDSFVQIQIEDRPETENKTSSKDEFPRRRRRRRC